MRNTERYHLVKSGKKYVLVSTTSRDILKALSTGSQYSYDELHEKTDIPVDSLYVFCQRLENAKLIKRVRKLSGEPRRIRTVIKAAKTVEFLEMDVLH